MQGSQQKSKGVVFQMTAPGLLAFSNIYEPRKFQPRPGSAETGEAKYDFQILLPEGHQDIPSMWNCAMQAAAEEFPGAVVRDAAGNFQGFSVEFDWALRDGNALADEGRLVGKDREFYRGFTRLQSRGKFPPGLGAAINGDRKDFPHAMPDRLAAKPYFYGGVLVLAKVQFHAYKVGGNKPCVTAYPLVLFSLNHGERNPKLEAGEGRSASAAFAGVVLPPAPGAAPAFVPPTPGHVGQVVPQGSPLAAPQPAVYTIPGLPM